jgi:hypothetical protein
MSRLVVLVKICPLHGRDLMSIAVQVVCYTKAEFCMAATADWRSQYASGNRVPTAAAVQHSVSRRPLEGGKCT